MPIVQAGSLNTTALVVPDLYVQIVPPQQLAVNGVPSNVVGVVGTASWGPVGRPVVCSTMADYAVQFGVIQARKYDMGTIVATAVQQGANDFRCVRVSDGTETSATITLGTNWLTLTALYTGTRGNQITAYLTAGGRSGTVRLLVGIPGQVSEVYDNIGTGLTGSALAAALAAAINGGNGAFRPPSILVIASAGNGTVAATVGTFVALAGGADGAAVTSAMMLGQDTLPRKGMYALRNSGCALLVLADLDDTAQFSVIAGFAVAESMYAMQVLPAGGLDTLVAVALKQAIGLDDPWTKLLHGDWVWWNDPVTGLVRLVSPQGFVAGRLANLGPQNSSLNKPLYGIVGTQKSGQTLQGQAGGYSSADLAVLGQAGIDVITNPQPGGAYWGVRFGHNSSTDATRSGDNYTRMTDYLATSLAASMGLYVGRVINRDLFRQIRASQLDFLSNMLGQGLLGTMDGSPPFSVVCDLTNNPLSRTSLGYVQSDVQVRYQAINEKFILNLEGGTTVQVVRQTVAAGQVAA